MSNLEQLYNSNWKFVKYKIDKAVYDESVREDLFQDLWLKVIKNEETFRNMTAENAHNYINVMTKNMLADYFKAHSKKHDNEQNIEDFLDILYQDDVVEEEVFKNVLSGDIEKFIAQLNEQDRLIVEKKFLGGMTDREVADAIGCSHEAVRVRAHRLRNSFRKMLSARELGILEGDFQFAKSLDMLAAGGFRSTVYKFVDKAFEDVEISAGVDFVIRNAIIEKEQEEDYRVRRLKRKVLYRVVLPAIVSIILVITGNKVIDTDAVINMLPGFMHGAAYVPEEPAKPLVYKRLDELNQSEEEFWYPMWLPEGFEFDYATEGLKIYFKNGSSDGRKIEIRQSFFSSDVTDDFSTEVKVFEIIDVKVNDGYERVFLYTDENYMRMTLSLGADNVAIYYYGSSDVNEIVKIGESLELK